MPSPAKKPRSSTTSLKIPSHMKTTIARLASDEGMTPHGYMLSLIKQGLARASKHREFVAEARVRLAEFDRTRRAIPADEFRRYLDDKAAGKSAVRPKPTKWRK
jgi:hypothetical protein